MNANKREFLAGRDMGKRIFMLAWWMAMARGTAGGGEHSRLVIGAGTANRGWLGPELKHELTEGTEDFRFKIAD
jgi:hypothetical protein